MRLPFHRYLGPGNSLQEGEPVDEDDAIARDHDLRYEEARSAEDVHAADEHSAGDFIDDFAVRGSLHSLAGAAGLTGKRLLEQHVLGRPIYGMPPTPAGRGGRKRDRQPSDSESNPEPQRMRQEGDDETDARRSTAGGATSANLFSPGGAGVGGGGQNDMQPVQQILRVPKSGGHYVTFHDSKILTSWGLTICPMQLKKDDATLDLLFTSLVHLPVEFPYFYLSPQQYSALPSGTRAVNCTVKVTPHGIRTPWKTGSTVVQPVNSDMLLYGQTATGLNHSLDIIPTVPKTFQNGNAMKVESFELLAESHHKEMAQKFWGNMSENDQAYNEKIPTCMGVPRFCKFYDCIFQSHDLHYPRLTKYVNTFCFKSHVGEPMINYEHSFGDRGLLKCPKYVPQHERMLTLCTNDDLTVGSRKNTKPRTYHDIHIGHNYFENDDRYFMTMELPLSRRGLRGNGDGPAQPTLNYGILAVNRGTMDDSSSKKNFQDVQAFWQVDSTLTVYVPDESINTFQYVPPSSHRFYRPIDAIDMTFEATTYVDSPVTFDGYPARIHTKNVATTAPQTRSEETRNRLPSRRRDEL